MALNLGLWIYIICIGMVLLFSVVCNTVAIYCVVRCKKLRSSTNVLISNLSVSDILLAGFVLPQRLHDLSHENDFYEGNILCKVVNFCPIFIITCSIYTLVCVAFERRRAIIDSSQWRVKTVTKFLPVIWILAFLVSAPTLIEYNVYQLSIFSAENNSTHTTISCKSYDKSNKFALSNSTFVVVVSYTIPVILIFKNYLEVAFFVWKRGRQIRGISSSETQTKSFHLLGNRMKIVKLLVVVAIIFAISWLPFFIILLYSKITRQDASNDANHFDNLFLLAVAAFSTAVNIVLYVVYNPGFNRAIKETLRWKQVIGARTDATVVAKSKSAIGQDKKSCLGDDQHGITDLNVEVL